ncbi:hypothetical protein [Vibrio rhodolitus]|uniref:hypothetical protein n=1 Tax=Vibrio rhodolitus TaxID=2231649 RepID=UPI000E0BBA8C|nr:hypothetical protein [Vibrio rhodolitus]
MNIWLLIAGVLGIFTALVHVFAGQVDPVRPFLKSTLAEVPKATLLACWHLVSVTLISSSLVILYIAWFDFSLQYLLVQFIGWLYVLFALVFISVGWYFFAHKVFFTLPQWILLLPIGGLALYGTW